MQLSAETVAPLKVAAFRVREAMESLFEVRKKYVVLL